LKEKLNVLENPKVGKKHSLPVCGHELWTHRLAKWSNSILEKRRFGAFSVTML